MKTLPKDEQKKLKGIDLAALNNKEHASEEGEDQDGNPGTEEHSGVSEDPDIKKADIISNSSRESKASTPESHKKTMQMPRTMAS